MQETVESIREYGVICPLIVRSGKEGGYEIIAGHRRKRACELIGLKTVPCFIRNLTDEEATITMVDSNIQREELLFSEKAYAYKMKLDAVDRVKGRPKKRDKLSLIIRVRNPVKSQQKEAGKVISRSSGISV